jgi:hypothetical protein
MAVKMFPPAGVNEGTFLDGTTAFINPDGTVTVPTSAVPAMLSAGWQVAVDLGNVGVSTAAAGSTTADAGLLPSGTSTCYPTTAADDTKGVRLAAGDAVTNNRIFIANGVANKILKVYPPTGGTINGAVADAGFSSASGKGVVIICLNGTTNAWAAF